MIFQQIFNGFRFYKRCISAHNNQLPVKIFQFVFRLQKSMCRTKSFFLKNIVCIIFFQMFNNQIGTAAYNYCKFLHFYCTVQTIYYMRNQFFPCNFMQNFRQTRLHSCAFTGSKYNTINIVHRVTCIILDL